TKSEQEYEVSSLERQKATAKTGTSESSSLERQKATENCRNPKIPGLSDRKRQEPCQLAGRVAGRPSPDLKGC
ncbi:hypothetical protein A2U01_0061489, partial [Trifolium medium]|nr:hypothetical protein [Trifolium medium]